MSSLVLRGGKEVFLGDSRLISWNYYRDFVNFEGDMRYTFHLANVAYLKTINNDSNRKKYSKVFTLYVETLDAGIGRLDIPEVYSYTWSDIENNLIIFSDNGLCIINLDIVNYIYAENYSEEVKDNKTIDKEVVEVALDTSKDLVRAISLESIIDRGNVSGTKAMESSCTSCESLCEGCSSKNN